MLQSCERGQLTYAGATPRGPKIEKDVMAVETREREPFPLRVKKRGSGNAARLLDRNEFRERRGLGGALVDTLRPHRI